MAQPPPQQVVVQKRGGGCMRFVLIAVGLIVVLGIVGALASRGGTNTGTGGNSGSTSPGVTPKPAEPAPSFAEIAAQKATLTDAQWDEYAKTLKGKRIENWTGTILNVDNKVLSDNYEIDVDLDSKGGSMNVAEAKLEVTKDEALPLQKGQGITFSGLIKQVLCFATYCPIEVQNVAFTVK